MPNKISIVGVNIDAEVKSGDSIARMLADADHRIEDGTIIVVSQKAVSKSEGQVRRLDDVTPSVLASGIASEYGKDARVVELVISEAKRIIRMKEGIIITQTHHGFVCANSGVDESNMPEGYAALLPKDPDSSARHIRSEIARLCSANVGVIISDTFGRPFRTGQTDCALGSAGIMPALDYEGSSDEFGRTMRTTLIAIVDELAGAAELVMRKTDRCPMALISGTGFEITDGAPGASSLIRPESEDLFL